MVRAETSRQFQPWRILLVEDHEDLAEAMLTVMTRAGYDVSWAPTAAAALQAFAPVEGETRPWPDLILLDLTLPDRTGVELVDALHELADPVPPIVVISAKHPGAISHAASEVHAAALLRKPFGIQDLITTIDRVKGL